MNMGGYFKVKSFGATGNGVTNNSFAIQKADDKASGRDGKGGVVWSPPGKYLIDPGSHPAQGFHVSAPVLLSSSGAGGSSAILQGRTISQRGARSFMS
jgi:polygalacturonase